MKFFKKVILFFINIIWYINLFIHPVIKWGLSITCVVNAFRYAFQNDAVSASSAGTLAIGSFVILVLSMMFINIYKPSNFSR